MKDFVLLTRAVSVVVVAGTALLSVPATADSGNHDWTGACVGANVGAGMSSGSIDNPDGELGSESFNERLIQGGVVGGYNKQFRSTVPGLEGEINWGDQNHQGTLDGGITPGLFENSISRVDWTGAILARVGKAGEDSLYFVEAGPAVARASGSVTRNESSENWVYNSWQPGFKAAVGAEFMVSDHLSVRAQYSMLTIVGRTAYASPGFTPGTTDRYIWTNSQAAATIGATRHF
jgi:outer membrane immunogenic protein